MKERSQRRTQKEQAEVKQRGPQSRIVLAVLQVTVKGEAGRGAFGIPARTDGFGRHEARNQTRDGSAVSVEIGEGGAKEPLLRGDNWYINERKTCCKHCSQTAAHPP